MKYHYFYKITNTINNYFYYGVHNTDNLNDGYMGSGTRLHRAYKKYGIENFTKEILKYFNTVKEAFDYEAEVVTENLVNDETCYNCIIGGKGVNLKGFATVKDKDGNIFKCSVNDQKYLLGEWVGSTKGYVAVKDNNDNIFMCSTNDPKYLSGEYVSIVSKKFTNTVLVKDKDDNYFRINKNDPKYLSGELTSYMTGKVHVKDKNGKIFTINTDDPRYLNGELVPLYTGTKWSDKSKENLKKVFAEKQHQKGEKNSQYNTCWIYNDKENKKIKKEDLEYYLSKGWLKGRKFK